MIDVIFDTVSLIFSWKSILAVIVIADIYCLCTTKRGSVWKYRKLYNTDINLILNRIDTMDGRDFEEFIAFLFELKGHEVVLTQETQDMGRDIIVDKDTFIECKRYDNHVFVGRPIIQKFLGSMIMFKAKKGIVINTGQYHKNAIEACNMVDDLELWGIYDITRMIKELDSTEILRYLNYDRKIWEAKEVKSEVI